MQDAEFADYIEERTLYARKLRERITGLEHEVRNARGSRKTKLATDLSSSRLRLRNMAAEFTSKLDARRLREAMIASAEATIEHLPLGKGQRVRAFPHIFDAVDRNATGLPLFEVSGPLPKGVDKEELEKFNDGNVHLQWHGSGFTVRASGDTLIRWVSSATSLFHKADALDDLSAVIASLKPSCSESAKVPPEIFHGEKDEH